MDMLTIPEYKKFMEYKIKLFNVLSNGLIDKSYDEIIQSSSNSILEATSYNSKELLYDANSKINYIINYIFRYIED